MGITERPYYGICNYQGPGIYKHYKGAFYHVYGLSVMEDSLDKQVADESGRIEGKVLVNYRPMTPGSMLPKITIMGNGSASAYVEMWSRDLDVFNEMVELDRNNAVRRFEKIA